MLKSAASGRSVAAALGFFDAAEAHPAFPDDDDDAATLDGADDGFIEYTLLFPAGTPPTTVATVAASLRTLAAATAPDYPWQLQPFRLAAVAPASPAGRALGLAPTEAALRGRSRVGGNLDDEWLITWLMVRATATHAQTGVVAHVRDADGDFLAIEASEVAPGWVHSGGGAGQPRTYVFGGAVHFIPPAPDGSGRKRGNTAAPPPGAVLAAVSSLAVGATHVRVHAAATLAPRPVQTVIETKLAAVPAAVMASTHVARVWVPLRLARLLTGAPDLVAYAVAAFYARDASESRAAARMRVFQWGGGLPLVPLSLRLSRYQFSQLAQSQYHPPKAATSAPPSRGGGGGGVGVGVDVGALAQAGFSVTTGIPTPDHPSYPEYDLGLKIGAGFEILLTQGEGGARYGRAVTTAASGAVGAVAAGAASSSPLPPVQTALEASPRFTRYMANLQRRGYFASATCSTPQEREARVAAATRFFVAGAGKGDSTAAVRGNGDAIAATAVLGAALSSVASLEGGSGGVIGDVVGATTAGEEGEGEELHPSTLAADVLLRTMHLPAPARDISAPTGAPWPPPAARNDDTEWMSDPAELEARMASYGLDTGGGVGGGGNSGGSGGKGGGGGGADDAQLKALMESLSGFMGRASGHEGVEGEAARTPTEDDDDDDDDDDDEEEDDDGSSDSDYTDDEEEDTDASSPAISSVLAGSGAAAGGPPAPSPTVDVAAFLDHLHAHQAIWASSSSEQQDKQPQRQTGASSGASSAALQSRKVVSPTSSPRSTVAPPVLFSSTVGWVAFAAELAATGMLPVLPPRSVIPSPASTSATSSLPFIASLPFVATAAAATAAAAPASATSTASSKRVAFAAESAAPSSSPGGPSITSAVRQTAKQASSAPPTSTTAAAAEDSEGVDRGGVGSVEEPSIADFMEAMDAELAGGRGDSSDEDNGGALLSSFAHLDDEGGDGGGGGLDGGDHSAPAVTKPHLPPPSSSSSPSTAGGVVPSSDADITYNLLASLAASVGSQAGSSGPASNVLGEMGVAIPHAWWAGAASGNTPVAGRTAQHTPTPSTAAAVVAAAELAGHSCASCSSSGGDATAAAQRGEQLQEGQPESCSIVSVSEGGRCTCTSSWGAVAAGGH